MNDLLNTLLGQAPRAGQHAGVSPEQSSRALEAAVPLLLSALGRNAAQGGAPGIEGAVAQHPAGDLDRFSQGHLPDTADGQKILGHVFGAQQTAAANAVGQRAGISPQAASQLLALAAPLVLSYLNRQRQGAGAQPGAGATPDLGGLLGGLLGGGAAGGVGGLGGLLGGLLGGGTGAQPGAQARAQPGQPDMMGTLNRALDRDGDGNALNDLIGMLGRR